MSTKYSKSEDVPTELLISRIEEIIAWITHGDKGPYSPSELTMRIPAEVDRDADLVLSEIIIRLKASLKNNEEIEKQLDETQNELIATIIDRDELKNAESHIKSSLTSTIEHINLKEMVMGVGKFYTGLGYYPSVIDECVKYYEVHKNET